MRSTLLLVDDDENVLRALQRVLRRDGYDIHMANSAARAMSILMHHPIHVVLSDQRMPEENGSELLSKVKDLYPHTVRLMLSGYTELASVTEAINEGAIYKFLTKPWDDEQLRANLREAFARHHMEMQNIMLKDEVESVNAELMVLNHLLEQRIEDRNEHVQRNQHYSQVLLEMFNHMPVGLVGVDSTGDVVVVNTALSPVASGFWRFNW
jgi:DNA-binding NtrC family response regulator